MNELAKVVAELGVDLWLDGQYLSAQVKDVASKTRAEQLLRHELASKYPNLLVSVTTVADATGPTVVTGAGAGTLSPPLSEDRERGGSGGDDWKAGLKQAKAPAAAPATVHGGNVAPAVTTGSASQRKGGESAAFGQGEQSTRPTVREAATPAAVEVGVLTTPATALRPSRRGTGASSAATAARRGSDAGVGGGDGDGRGAACSLSSSFGTASGPPASAVGTGGFSSVGTARVPSPANTGDSGALAPAGVGQHTLAPTSAAFPARTNGAAAAPTPAAGAGYATDGGEATADSRRAAAAPTAAVVSDATDASRPAAFAAGSSWPVRQEIDTVVGPERDELLTQVPQEESVGHGGWEDDEEEQGQRLMMSFAMPPHLTAGDAAWK
ncbi:unnamed protein product [Ectocarpus fasciculatus]